MAGTSINKPPNPPPLPPNQHHPQTMNFLSAVELKVFQSAISNYRIHGKFLKDDGISLHWIFGPLIHQALELVDDDSTNIAVSGSSAKVLVQVYGTGGEVYWIPPGRSLCQCIAFLRGKRPYCKHVLAAHIALAIMGEEEYEVIEEGEMINIFNKFILNK